MSRGIDVKEINMVVNFDVPYDAEDYVHRVGRTARINAKGEAITLVIPKEIGKFRKIEQLIETIIPKEIPKGDLGPLPGWEDRPSPSHSKKRFFRKNKSKNK
jgi:superfamily II DNA/RNA helicase